MADDIVFMVAGRAFGKEEFATGFKAMKSMNFDASSEILEIEIGKNTAWCRTRLKLAMTAPDRTVKRRSGYTLSILRKTPEGKWVMARDANLLAAD
jgi:ketosteroid isomerase-like protein